MSKLSDKLKKMFSKTKGANYPAKFEQTAFKAGQKTRSLFKGKKKADVFSKSKDLVTASAAKKLRKLGKLSKVAKLARIATPIGLGTVAAQAIYQTANPSKEAKAKIKAAKKKMSKITTKQAHADLLKNSAKTGKMMKASLGLLAMRKAKKKGAKGVELLSPAAMATRFFNKGGDIMLTGKQKKLDKDGDGKISGNDFKMMKANTGKMASFSKFVESQTGAATTKKELKELKTKYIKKMSGAAISESEARKFNKTIPKLYKGGESKMMKAFKGSIADSKKSSQEKSKVRDQMLKKVLNAQIADSEAENLLSMSTSEMKNKLKNTDRDFKVIKKVAGGAAIKGMGAARTSGMGLQDEDLIPGKSMDYYKDIV